mmetsp:Transcript_103076/g.142640  ORF Transcript_103076/g.142640 Transcript_103076/m.142640 type:complete len:342 (+) Transcript_103076:159-1184(+)
MSGGTILERSIPCIGGQGMVFSAREYKRNGECLGELDRGSLDIEFGIALLNSVEDHAGDNVRVHVGGRAAVLQVAVAVGVSGARYADGAATVGNAVREPVDGRSFVLAGEAALVALAIRGDVLSMLGSEAANGLLDHRVATLLAHLLGGEVGVAACAVPVALDRLGVEGHMHAKVLAYTLEDVPRDHHLVGACDAFARADLVLPLARHDLGIGARDGDAGVQTGLVVRLGDEATEGAVGASATIVGALRAWVAALRPAERRDLVEVEEGVLLLNAKPGLLALAALECLDCLDARVGRQRLASRRVGIGQHKDVVARTEGILENGLWLDDDLRVLTRSLTSR